MSLYVTLPAFVEAVRWFGDVDVLRAMLDDLAPDLRARDGRVYELPPHGGLNAYEHSASIWNAESGGWDILSPDGDWLVVDGDGARTFTDMSFRMRYVSYGDAVAMMRPS